MSTSYLSIPMAVDIDSKRYIKPHEADPNAKRGRYICTDSTCNKPVQRILRSSTCFFRHYPEDGRIGHSKNQDLHTRAIHLIFDQFSNVLEYGLSIPIFTLDTKYGPKEVVPFLGQYKVKKEYPVGERKIDVAILDDFDRPLLLIEVLNTHKVSQEKSLDLIDYPWVEIKAKYVLQNQRVIKVDRHHRFPQEFDSFCQLSFFNQRV